MRKSIQAIIIKLESIRDQVQEYADNAADRGQDDKSDQLNEEVEYIEAAIESLQNIE